MATGIVRWLIIGRYVAKVLNEIAKRVRESTPEEREEVRKHVVAIYDILRAASEREGQNLDVPMLMLGQGIPDASVADRTERMRNSIITFRHTFRRYKHHLNKENREEVLVHAKEIARVIAEIEKRTRASR